MRGGGRVRQQIVRALGRKDMLLASGELDRLVASLARHSEQAMIPSEMEAGRLCCTRIGGPLLFGRLWERLGIAEDWESLNREALSFLRLASIRLMLRTLCNPS